MYYQAEIHLFFSSKLFIGSSDRLALFVLHFFCHHFFTLPVIISFDFVSFFIFCSVSIFQRPGRPVAQGGPPTWPFSLFLLLLLLLLLLLRVRLPFNFIIVFFLLLFQVSSFVSGSQFRMVQEVDAVFAMPRTCGRTAAGVSPSDLVR